MYSEELKIAADWEFMVCAVCKFNVPYKHIEIEISVYDNHGISSNPKHRQLLLDEKNLILNKHFSAYMTDALKLRTYEARFDEADYKLLTSLRRGKFSRRITKLTLNCLSMIFGKKD